MLVESRMNKRNPHTSCQVWSSRHLWFCVLSAAQSKSRNFCSPGDVCTVCVCLLCELPLWLPPRTAAGVDGAEALSHWLFACPYITFHCPFFLSRLLRALSVVLFCFSLRPIPVRKKGCKSREAAEVSEQSHPEGWPIPTGCSTQSAQISLGGTQ